MANLFSKIIDILLPPRCIKCGQIITSADGLCEDCFNEVTFITHPFCAKCGIPFENAPHAKDFLCGHCLQDTKSPFRMSRSALKYDDNSKPLILAFKFMDKTENARVFAKWMKISGEDIFVSGVDLIIPVPLHYTRLVKRRYNQSAILAGELSKLTGLKVDYNSVVRHVKTRPQVEFSGHARVKNVKGVFSVKHPEHIYGQRILLLDDVMTTGSTLKECAKALLKAGAKSVDTLTVARVC